jgi:hypothetical protein
MSISEAVPNSTLPGPYRETPALLLLQDGICPNSGRPCDELTDLYTGLSAAVQRLREEVGAHDATDTSTSELHPLADAAVEAYYQGVNSHGGNVQRILGGTCTGGCEIAPPRSR